MRQALEFVVGADAKIEETGFEGHHGNPILLFTVREKRSRTILDVFARMRTEDLARLRSELPARIDPEGAIFVRFSKQDAYLGVLALAVDEDAIQMRLKVASYPAKPEVALASLEEHLHALLLSRETVADGGAGQGAEGGARGPA